MPTRRDFQRGLASLAIAGRAIPAPTLALAPAARLLGRIENRNRSGVLLFTSDIFEEPDGRVHFKADADIDADGANGQNGGPYAYTATDSGTDFLANAAMRRRADGKVVCSSENARSIVILGADREPKVFPNGMIASKTWYRHRNRREDDPAAYVDSETVPYIVVPPLIVARTAGVVRGCRARATFRGRSVEGVVADRGPASKTGEISIAMARALGIPPSPRNGGRGTPDILYELWPGQAAPGFELQPA